MRKIEYIAPEMEIVEVKSQMLAASNGTSPGGGTPSVNPEKPPFDDDDED